mgnify:CR=1 FL=1
MNRASEEKTKGFVAEKLKNIPNYPSSQNTEVDGVIWFKEDSYKGTSYDWLSGVFATASKKQTRKSKGTPDFMVVKNESNVIVVIECKGSSANHSSIDNIEEFATHGFGTPEETEGYAVNGALWYASFLSDNYDVISMYENFYNNHYAHSEEAISLVLDKKITCINEHWGQSTTETTVGIYRVISEASR